MTKAQLIKAINGLPDSAEIFVLPTPKGFRRNGATKDTFFSADVTIYPPDGDKGFAVLFPTNY